LHTRSGNPENPGPSLDAKEKEEDGGIPMICSIGKIEQRELEEIKSLEKELGKTVLAFQCSSDIQPARLSDSQLQRLREIEEKLSLSLVAVEY
jgi:hypothetical protein